MNNSFWASSKGFVALLFIASASYFLIIEHREHLFEWLPFLIILLCPVMHLFMQHGHEGHSNHSDTNMADRDASPPLKNHDMTDSDISNSQKRQH